VVAAAGVPEVEAVRTEAAAATKFMPFNSTGQVKYTAPSPATGVSVSATTLITTVFLILALGTVPAVDGILPRAARAAPSTFPAVAMVASFVANHSDLNQVWLVVSPQNPLKAQGSLLNEYDRLHLAKLAIEDDTQIKVSDIEFSLPKPSYTIDTMAYLQDKFPLEKFSIIMGSDSFQNIERWKNAEILIANYEIIIYKIPGYEIDNKVDLKTWLKTSKDFIQDNKDEFDYL
jgi:nicotinate (nicotinamide) nucleotide adenylyltransferase